MSDHKLSYNNAPAMPPKKKARTGARTAATPTPSVASSMIGEDEVHPSSPPKARKSPEKTELEQQAYDPLNDLWTDEQETSLFKGLIRWKPAGELTPYYPSLQYSIADIAAISAEAR